LSAHGFVRPSRIASPEWKLSSERAVRPIRS
jgi:hypothetical protein